MIHILKNPVASAQNMVQRNSVNAALMLMIGWVLAKSLSNALPYHLATPDFLVHSSDLSSRMLVMVIFTGAKLVIEVISFFIISGLVFKTGITLPNVLCLFGVRCIPEIAGCLVASALPLTSVLRNTSLLTSQFAGLILITICYQKVIDHSKEKKFFSLCCSIAGGSLAATLIYSAIQAVVLSTFRSF